MAKAAFTFGHWIVGAFPAWHWSGAGGYLAYRGKGDEAADVDWATPVAGANAGETTVRLRALTWDAGDEYVVGLRAVSDAGVLEEGELCLGRVVIDGAAMEGSLPNALADASAVQAAGGRFTVTFAYSRLGEAAEAASVQVAEVTGGVPNWAAPIQTVTLNASGSTIWSGTPTAAWADTTSVILALRAITAGGVGGPVTTLAAIAADAVGPDPVDSLAAAQLG